MDDKNLMENILLLEKGACDLFMHGTVESSTENVHKAFCTALNEALCLQNSIYEKMKEKGWYPSENVESSKITTVKEKFRAQ